jgi:ABC-type glycerol-3-phosphate transport system permease component
MVTGGRGLAQRVSRALFIAILLFGALVMMIPFAWSLSTALKPLSLSMQFPPVWWPHPWVWSNFTEVFQIVPFARWFLNSFIVAASVTLGNLIIDSLAGYALARIDFKGRTVLFIAIVAMLMVPFQAVMLPVYLLLRALGLIDTYLGMILPAVVSSMGIFLMRQAFLNIPRELDDAAIMDGCGRLRMFWQIAVPQVGPSLLTLALMIFVGSWNNFLLPLLVANNPNLWTVQLGIVQFQLQYQTNWPYLMAAGAMATVPIALLFLIFQRRFVQGWTISGIQ